MANLSPFLRLPLEVRAQIYDYLLKCDEYRINPQPDGTNPPTRPQLYPSILATNKQINTEAMSVLYDRNPWIVISITSTDQPAERQLRVPCLPVPDPIRRRLHDPSKAPGLTLLLRIEDGDSRDATQDDHATPTTKEFMLDYCNFARLCRFNLADFFTMDRYVVPAFDHGTRPSEKTARLYHKIMGCLGEANGRNYAQKEPFIMDLEALDDEDGKSMSSDLALLSYGYYRDLKTLLRRLDHYEKEACRLETIGQRQAAQCLRLDCLELADYEMFYSSREWTDREDMIQLLDRVMSMAILCATSSLDVGNIEIIPCVQSKVRGMTIGDSYSMDDFRFDATEDYKVIMDQCAWRMLRDQYFEGPPTVQELQEMMQYRSKLAPGADAWGVYSPAARDFMAQYYWPEAAASKPNPASGLEDTISDTISNSASDSEDTIS